MPEYTTNLTTLEGSDYARAGSLELSAKETLGGGGGGGGGGGEGVSVRGHDCGDRPCAFSTVVRPTM